MDQLRIHSASKTITNGLAFERRMVQSENLLTHTRREFIFLLFLLALFFSFYFLIELS